VRSLVPGGGAGDDSRPAAVTPAGGAGVDRR